MTPRDSQRSKVYAAQEQLIKGQHFKTVSVIDDYVKGIIGSHWFKNRWPNIEMVQIKDGRGRYSACAGRNYLGHFIKLPRWSRYERLILHELAHVVTPENYAWHGRGFVKNFIALLEWKMKINPRPVFREYRVKWHSKRKNNETQNHLAISDNLVGAFLYCDCNPGH